MRFVDEFRDRQLIDRVAVQIRYEVDTGRTYRIMEVCGTHTMNIFRFGLRDLLPSNIELVSGPGCPVCVTPNAYLDKAIWLARRKGVIVTAFGDMFRVPGSFSSLENEKACGAQVKVVYSSLDALEIARKEPDKEVVFLGVGFETTIPTVAQAVIEARHEGLDNFSVLCGHKTMPGILKTLAADKAISIDGLLLPGHVSAVTGAAPYRFLPKRYSIRCVIAGFEPLDILESILMLIRQKKPALEIQYTRIMAKDGNPLARKSISQVFDAADSEWRGIGMVSSSGLKVKKSFADFDADVKFRPKPPRAKESKGCICGEVLKGIKRPDECRLFGKICTESHPVGSCMVSSEGVCAAYYKYSDKISV